MYTEWAKEVSCIVLRVVTLSDQFKVIPLLESLQNFQNDACYYPHTFKMLPLQNDKVIIH